MRFEATEVHLVAINPKIKESNWLSRAIALSIKYQLHDLTSRAKHESNTLKN